MHVELPRVASKEVANFGLCLDSPKIVLDLEAYSWWLNLATTCKPTVICEATGISLVPLQHSGAEDPR